MTDTSEWYTLTQLYKDRLPLCYHFLSLGGTNGQELHTSIIQEGESWLLLQIINILIDLQIAITCKANVRFLSLQNTDGFMN